MTSRWHDPAMLMHLERLRRPVAGQTRHIVEGVLARYLPFNETGRLVEIGCGGGQLREWLPAPLRARTMHTDTSLVFLANLLQRCPGAQACLADAATLPFPNASLSGILGLCAFDSIPSPEAARNEIRRALIPGGIFVHFLDLGTELDPVFRDVQNAGYLPLPNFLGEEQILAGLNSSRRSRFPKVGPFDDLLLTPREPWCALVAFLAQSGHPLHSIIASYAELFPANRVDSYHTAQAFMQLTSDRDRLRALNKALLAIFSMVQDPPYRERIPFDVSPLASHEHFQKRLERLFSPTEGFSLEMSAIVASRGPRPYDDSLPPGCGYFLRRVGRSIWSPQPPNELAGIPLGQITGLILGTTMELPRQGLETLIEVESAVFVFVARKHIEGIGPARPFPP